MQTITNESFLTHIAADGLRLDDRYKEPRTLSYQNDLWFAAPMPSEVRHRNKAIFVALDLFDGVPAYVYRRTGKWNYCQRKDRNVRDTVDRAVDSILKLLGIPDGANTTLLFEPSEKDLLYALIYLNSIGAASVADDLFVVPEDQGFTLYFDHDEQIILQSRDEPTHTKIFARLQANWAKLQLPPFED